jgi:hypothetical protein
MQKICRRKWKNGSSLNGTNFLNKTLRYVISGLNGKTQHRHLPSHFWKILIGLGMRIDCFTTKSERYFYFCCFKFANKKYFIIDLNLTIKKLQQKASELQLNVSKEKEKKYFFVYG